MAGPVQRHADKRLAARVDVGRGQHRSNAGGVLCGLDIDGNHLRMRMRAPHETGVQHARQLDVVDVAAVAAEQALELAAGDACADAGGREATRPSASPPVHHRFDRVDDGVVTGAAAHVTRQDLPDAGAGELLAA